MAGSWICFYGLVFSGVLVQHMNNPLIISVRGVFLFVCLFVLLFVDL